MHGKMKKLCKKWMMRFAVNLLVGTIVALFIYRSQPDPFVYSFLISQVITFSVSTSAFVISDIFNFLINPVFTTLKFSLYVFIILLVSAAGAFAGVFISNAVFPCRVNISGEIIPGIVIPSLLISIIFIVVFTSIGRTKQRQTELENDLIRYKQEKAKMQKGSISVKEDDVVLKLDFQGVIYLSSSGRVSLVHTVGRDYQVNQLLGNMESSLPSDVFIRIHKQFIVNRRFIKGIRYNEGGRYNLYLSDDDENILPIGKAYTANVKRMMNI
jgi:hypothetical protein